jgi:hypothetical protein
VSAVVIEVDPAKRSNAIEVKHAGQQLCRQGLHLPVADPRPDVQVDDAAVVGPTRNGEGGPDADQPLVEVGGDRHATRHRHLAASGTTEELG